MKKKRILSMLLVMCMVLSMAACGKSSEDKKESSGGGDDEVTIVYMRQAGNTAVEDELIKEFEKQNPGSKCRQTTFLRKTATTSLRFRTMQATRRMSS